MYKFCRTFKFDDFTNSLIGENLIYIASSSDHFGNCNFCLVYGFIDTFYEKNIKKIELVLKQNQTQTCKIFETNDNYLVNLSFSPLHRLSKNHQSRELTWMKIAYSGVKTWNSRILLDWNQTFTNLIFLPSTRTEQILYFWQEVLNFLS